MSSETKYPVSWKLGDVYESDEKWYADLETVRELIGQLGEYKGTLTDSDGIYNFVKFAYDGPMVKKIYRLNLYECLRSSLDASDPAAMNMAAGMNSLFVQLSQESAFVDSEIYSLPLEKRMEILNEERFKPYKYAMREWINPDKIIYSEETNRALAVARSVFGRADETYSVLKDVDNQPPEIRLPDGTTPKISQAVFDSIIYGDYDHDFKVSASESFYTTPKQYINTYASLLTTRLMEYRAGAMLEGFEHVRAYRLHDTDIEEEIYNNIIASARSMTGEFARFNTLHKKAAGLEEQYYFDTMDSVSPYSAKIDYEDAIEQVEAALAPLGEDYLRIFDDILMSGHIDVYPSEKKRDGGFMTSCGDSSIYPYVLLNYSGFINEASTIAHEMGHVMYGYYSENCPDNNSTTNQPTIFTHEIASTCNEYMFFSYMKNKVRSDDERLFYLEKIIDLINGTIMRQCMYSEFEDYLYGIIEADGALDAESVSDKWMELNHEYYGESVMFSPSFRYRWAEIPHFYYGYYVYQYATSATYSAIISDRILAGDTEATEGYLSFLSMGASRKCSELLKSVGIDVFNPETYKALADYYSSLVDEFQRLAIKPEEKQ